MLKDNAADTVRGQIFIGVVLAIFGVALSWVVSRATYEQPPLPVPEAVITPDRLVVQANEMIEFSAAGSKPATSTPLVYSWLVGGLSPEQSSVARCESYGAILRCRFALPGTFAITVEVLDSNGQRDSTSSTLTVRLSGGYLGLVLTSGNTNAHKALLYDIDWVKLQSLVTKQIVLFDPDTNGPIYAIQVQTPQNTLDPPPWQGSAQGLKLALPGLRREAGIAFEIAFSEIGILSVRMPAGEIQMAQTAGAVDVGFVSLDSPEELTIIMEEFR